MGGVMGHNCNDPRCSGCNIAKLVKKLKKVGFVMVSVFDASPAFTYSIGLYAHFNRPELFMWLQPGESYESTQEHAAALGVYAYDYAHRPVAASAGEPVYITRGMIQRAAAFLAAPKANESQSSVGDGEVVASAPFAYLWPVEEVVVPYSPRTEMGQAKTYYRERHMRRIEDVPVFVLSPNPYTSVVEAVVCTHVLQDPDALVWVGRLPTRGLAAVCARSIADSSHQLAHVHEEHLFEWWPDIESSARALRVGDAIVRTHEGWRQRQGDVVLQMTLRGGRGG